MANITNKTDKTGEKKQNNSDDENDNEPGAEGYIHKQKQNKGLISSFISYISIGINYLIVASIMAFGGVLLSYVILEYSTNNQSINNDNPTQPPIYGETIPWIPPNGTRLECPKEYCNKIDNNGRCIIYIPYTLEEYYINATEQTNNYINVTKYSWNVPTEQDIIIVSGEESDYLNIGIINIGNIDINLVIIIEIRGKITSSLYYYSVQQCSYTLIIYKSPYFGIDLGTTYSCIAYQKSYINSSTNRRDPHIVVIDNKYNEHCIPTSIYFPPNNASIIIGYLSKLQLKTDPKNVIYDIKRIIGRNINDKQIKIFRKQHKFQLTNDFNPEIIIPNRNNMTIRAEQALAAVLIHLVNIASNTYNIPYTRDVVVSIPAIFHNSQRKAVGRACNLAGLNVKQLIVEPSAASIAYKYYTKVINSNSNKMLNLFMAFDFGGGTLDCSVLKCVNFECEVLGVSGNSSLGGIDFDNVITDIITNKYINKYKWEITDKMHNIIASKSENIKKYLTKNSHDLLTISNKNGFKKEIIITRKEFETHPQTIKLVASAINTAKQALNDERFKDQNLKVSNIRAILMVGGTSKIPIIRETLIKTFVNPTLHINNRDPLRIIYPDEESSLLDSQLMVVLGTAVIGGDMAFNENTTFRSNNIFIHDVLPMNIGFDVCEQDINNNNKLKCGIMDPLIPKNSKYPVKGNGIYCQSDPNSHTATLELYEGNDFKTSNNFLISKLEISNVPIRNSNECNNILVELSIDENGICKINALVNGVNIIKKLPVKSNDGILTDNEIKKYRKQMEDWFDADISKKFANI